MRYTETTPSYSMTKDFSFINRDGRRPGMTGEFCFEAPVGTLLAYGQKDIRKGRGGVDGYRICMPDGSMPAIVDALARELRKLPEAERPAGKPGFKSWAIYRYGKSVQEFVTRKEAENRWKHLGGARAGYQLRTIARAGKLGGAGRANPGRRNYALIVDRGPGKRDWILYFATRKQAEVEARRFKTLGKSVRIGKTVDAYLE